jgi:geranylgeranyl pyrophosphate synthase
MEARLRWNAGATLDLYMQVIDGKTAALFEACACGAAMLSTDDVAAREAFKKFGLSFGMSFQILDDILDYFTDAEAWGKEPLKDLKEGLVTLPLIMALGNGNNTGREAAIDYLRTSGASPLDIPAVSKFVSGSGAVERCSEMALSFIRQGVSSLGAHADSSGLKAFAEESLKRRF